MTSGLRIVIAGRLAAAPGQGGAAWAVLQWVLGFASLGHQVFLVEPLMAPSRRQRRYFRDVVRRFELGRSAAILDRGRWLGVAGDSVQRAVEQADILVNLSGVAARHDFIEKIPVRVYVDLDPGFTQLWHLSDIDVGLEGHTHFATVGQQIGTQPCPIPDLGKSWVHVLPPVALEYWPATAPPARERFTTVANWRTYGSASYQGVVLRDKVHSFRRFVNLPSDARIRMEVALTIAAGDEGDRRWLLTGGWRVLDARRVAGSPDSYQRFIQRSSAEIGIAKSGYVTGRTGWVSDRSAAYLATGRPVLMQDSGFQLHESGRGLLTFSDIGTAIDEAKRLRRDYRMHCGAARAFAEEHLAADVSLRRLLKAVGAA
jgi:hypothetical protein